jgi:WS/DGAT/MGAT family acyltransferase
MHVGGVVVIDPEDGFDFTEVVELIRSRLDLVPRYRQKVRNVPGRLGRPVWIDDDDFDLSYHVRRSALPKPGNRAQLDELVGRLISRPLDRSRPLWEMYVVEGLEGGRVALINKTHQALVDRIGAVDVAAAILDLARSPRTLPDQPWIPTPSPSDIDLVVDAVADVAARPSEALEALRLATVDLRTLLSRMTEMAGSAIVVAKRTIRPAPRSVLNQPTGGQRRFAAVACDLQQFKDIRKAHAGTVNDVILAVLTGALRNWLLSRGEPVTSHTALRAMVPVALRTTGETESLPVASFLVDLPVAEPNPAMRLHQVSFAMGIHTEAGTQVGADALVELGRFAPPTLHAMGARVAGQLSRRMYNVLVTNVPGPQIPLYAGGSMVEAMYPVAPLAKGHTLAVACTSYNGRVFFGLTADRDAMPDVEEFADLITEAVDELVHTLPPGTPGRSGRRRRSTTAGSTAPSPAGRPADESSVQPGASRDGSGR